MECPCIRCREDEVTNWLTELERDGPAGCDPLRWQLILEVVRAAYNLMPSEGTILVWGRLFGKTAVKRLFEALQELKKHLEGGE